jgi:uncharacterized protein
LNHSFHLSCRVADLAASKRFYADVLGCEIGGGGDTWSNIDFFGHQLTLHQCRADAGGSEHEGNRSLDHFGLTLPEAEWSALLAATQTNGAKVQLLRQPREPGNPDPRGKFVISDPDGFGLEFKCSG